ncbi:hypothetical protein OQA88_13664 [Cercophora sp. LCS_1]
MDRIFDRVGALLEKRNNIIPSLVTFYGRLSGPPPRNLDELISHITFLYLAQPLVFTFLALQLSFALFPILLFVSFVSTVTLVFLGIAIVSALFWAGIALAILVLVLSFSFFAASFAWLGVLGVRELYKKYRAWGTESVRSDDEDKTDHSKDRNNSQPEDENSIKDRTYPGDQKSLQDHEDLED